MTTIRQLKNKIEQLEKENNQLKVAIKDLEDTHDYLSRRIYTLQFGTKKENKNNGQN